MKFLVIDTSSAKSFVLLYKDGSIMQAELPTSQQQVHLLPEIDRQLAAAHLRLNDLDFLAVGNGPGAFTGTRIGVLTAKTLSYAKNLPLVSFCSLLPYTPTGPVSFLLLIDAKSQRFYTYDGKNIVLKTAQTLEIPRDCSIFSPHPDRIPFPAIQATLNFPFLLNHLKHAFEQGRTIPYALLKVEYLHSP